MECQRLLIFREFILQTHLTLCNFLSRGLIVLPALPSHSFSCLLSLGVISLCQDKGSKGSHWEIYRWSSIIHWISFHVMLSWWKNVLSLSLWIDKVVVKKMDFQATSPSRMNWICIILLFLSIIDCESGTIFDSNPDQSSLSVSNPLDHVCVDIPSNMSLCQGIGYHRMRLPNLAHHETLQEVSIRLLF